MSEWQPINTAPRDGTVILITRYGDTYAAFFDVNDGAFPWIFLDPGSQEYTNGWQDDVDRFGPTHWMPMPAPSQEQRSPESGK